MIEVLYGIGAGISAGITYGLTSFAKKKGQPFDGKKFATTIILGAIAGATWNITGIQTEMAYNYLITLGAVPVIENLLKTVWRKLLGQGD